jgi:hypothetical protein
MDRETAVHIHSGVLFSHKEEWKYPGKWIELEIIMLSEISQAQKDKYPMFSLMWRLDLKILMLVNVSWL